MNNKRGQRASNPRDERHANWRHDLYHHLFVALVVASVVTLAHHGGWLNWLDSIMLRIVAGVGVSKTSPDPRQLANLPLVLTIGDDLYEQEFRQASPLDRTKLATLVETIFSQCPSRVAIDLDLSPSPGGDAAAQGALDALLANARDRRCTAPVDVILTTPFPVETEGLLAEKHEWMKRLCAGGVRFALADVFMTQGAVMQFAPELPTLGVAAYDGKADIDLCAQIANGSEGAYFLRTSAIVANDHRIADFHSQLPLNASFFAAAEAMPMLLALNAIPASAAGRAVFLGGGYSSRDRFATPFDERTPGVMVHAAIYYTLLEKVGKVERWGAFLLDIALGLCFAYLFHWTWTRHELARRRLIASEAGRWVFPYLVARGWLLGNVGLVTFAILGLVLISAYFFYPMSIWVNPGPIVVGVSIKSYLASRDAPHEVDSALPARARGARTHTMPATVIWLERSLGVGFVVWCVVGLMAH